MSGLYSGTPGLSAGNGISSGGGLTPTPGTVITLLNDAGSSTLTDDSGTNTLTAQ